MRRLALRVAGGVVACAGAVLLVAGGCCWLVYDTCERGAVGRAPE